MLTETSKFTDFISLCISNGACSAAPDDAIPSMQDAARAKLKRKATCAEGFTLYRDGTQYAEAWAPWVLHKIGNQLDVNCRRYFIDKITIPMTALQLRVMCDFFTATEHTLLLAKYEGQLPTAEKEILDGVIILKPPVGA